MRLLIASFCDWLKGARKKSLYHVSYYVKIPRWRVPSRADSVGGVLTVVVAPRTVLVHFLANGDFPGGHSFFILVFFFCFLTQVSIWRGGFLEDRGMMPVIAQSLWHLSFKPWGEVAAEESPPAPLTLVKDWSRGEGDRIFRAMG